jgi:hypothetical protein
LVFVEGSGELSDCGGYFDSGEENSFLALEGDVFGPFDEAGEVGLVLDGVADSVVTGSLFEERVHLLLYFLGSLFAFDAFTLDYAKITIYLPKIIILNIHLIPPLPPLAN